MLALQVLHRLRARRRRSNAKGAHTAPPAIPKPGRAATLAVLRQRVTALEARATEREARRAAAIAKARVAMCETARAMLEASRTTPPSRAEIAASWSEAFNAVRQRS